MDVKLPDGTIVQNIPGGTSKADLVAKLKANGMNVPDSWVTAPAQPPAANPSFLDKALAALNKYGDYASDPVAQAKVAGHYLSGAVAAPVAGIAGLLSGGNADVVNQVQNGLTYNPKDPNAQNAIGAADTALGAIPKGADMTGQAVASATNSPLAGTAVNTALQAIPMALGAKFGPKSAGMTSTLNDTALQSLKDAGDLNLVVTPSDAGMTGANAVAKGAESSGSMTKLQQAATKVNANRIVEGVKQDLGVPPEQQLTPTVIKQRSADADAMYQAVRDADKNQLPVKSTNGLQLRGPTGEPLTKPAGPIQLGDDYRKAVDSIGADRVNPDFGSKIDPAVQSLKDELSAPTQLSTDGAVSKINTLREDARTNLSAVGDTAKRNLGRAQMQAANAIEGQLSSYLENQPGVYQAMLKGRELKAKLGTVKDAYDAGSGNIDASVIHRDLENGVPLSGNMEKIGRVYGQFSKVMGDPTKIATGHNSIVDTGLVAQGGLRALGGDMSGLGEAALGAARPVARKLALSNGYQNMLRSGQAPSGILSSLAIPAGAVPVTASDDQQ